jgi:hypothetical protein
VVGEVYNFFFDDQSWNVCYLVVDLRDWLSRRQVLISTSITGHVDWEKKIIPVSLTSDQVRRSPDIASTKPVNRQQEIALREYYGWPAHWGEVCGEFRLPALPAGREYPVRSKEDPHLRSVAALTGYEVWDQSTVGRLVNFVMDHDSWHIRYLDVKTGNWLLTYSLWLPTQKVESVSWANHRVNIGHSGTEQEI